MKKRIISLLLAIVMCFGTVPSALAAESAAEPAEETSPGVWKAAPVKTEKPRVIATNDAECDDMNSFLRFLLYSDMYDIEGLVYTSSKFHWSGGVNAEGETVEPYRWMPVGWMEDWIDLYGKYYDNYKLHGDFATPEELKSVVAEGNIKFYDELYGSTEGSDLIKNALLDDDERPVHLLAWGGTSSIAQALKDIQEEYSGTAEWDAIYQKVSSKAIIGMLTTQDGTYETYISQEWPDITMLHCNNFWGAYAYGWENGVPDELVDVFYADWMKENIIFNHGDYMSNYFTWYNGVHLEGETDDNQFGTNEDLLTNWWGAGFMGVKRQYDFISEGDTPTFLNLIDVGLRSTEDPGYGGWGGRYEAAEYKNNPEANYYTDVADANTEDGITWINNKITENKEITRNALVRWSEDSMNDFAVRADWLMAENYEDANHAPVVAVEEGLDFIAEPGATIVLHGTANDPDGNNVDLSWMYYWDAGTYGKDVPFEDNGDGTITFTIPKDAKAGDTIHMVLTGRDDGEHNLARYQRVIVTVTDNPSEDLTEEQLSVIAEQSVKNKVNTILTTDGEPDDMDSMLRYLTYANEFNTKAIVFTSSQSHWSGGTILDQTGKPVAYDEALHGPVNPDASEQGDSYVDPFAYDPTPDEPSSGDEYQALRYKQYRFNGFGWFEQFLQDYAESYEMLSSHDDAYPTVDELRNIFAVGNIKYKSEMTEVTEGSELIKKTILENPDGEPLVVQAWGGTNTLARALKSIEEQYKETDQWAEIYNKIGAELSCYMINTQDTTYADYISVQWPNVRVYQSGISFLAYVRGMPNMVGQEVVDKYFSAEWCDTLTEIGSPLLSQYLTVGGDWSLVGIGVDEENPYYTWKDAEHTNGFFDPKYNDYNAFPDDEYLIETWGEKAGDESGNPGEGNGSFYSEGDTPSYLFLIDVGLRSFGNPSWGGWGGRFVENTPNVFTCATDYMDGKASTNWPVGRWAGDVQADFSARAQWTVSEDANHNPMSGVMNGLDLTAKPGETLTLNGVAYDPNGDGLSYKWWQYYEADTYDGEKDNALNMSGADTRDLTVTIPEDAEDGDTIHLIFETKDTNELPMKAYKRVVITVEDTSSTGGGTSSGGGSSSGNKTETTTNPDGSTTTTVTKPDGSKTETTKAPNGSSSVVNTDKNGQVSADVTVSSSAVTSAEGAVALPMPGVTATTNADKAPTVTVDLPTSTATKVEIPVNNVTAGTVAVLVKGDGTEEVIKTSFATEDGVVVELKDGDTVKIVNNGKTFADVSSGFWGADAVAFATSHELFNGVSDTKFAPNAEMTRAMIVTVLARLEGVDTTTGSTWYEAGQKWAMENGISDGSNMMGSLTREQLATMLYRYVGSPVVSGAITGFSDTNSISDWASDAMLWAVQNGIISGSNGKLNPQGNATRAEVATMLMRYIEKMA